MLVTISSWWRSPGLPQRILRALWPALKEVVFALAVSNSALLVLVTIWALSNPASAVSFDSASTFLSSSIKSSQILVYVMAILAAPLWLMLTRWRAKRHVAFFNWMLCIQSLIVLGSALVFAVDTLGRLQNELLAERWALWCLIVSIVIWIVTLVYVRVWVDAATEEPRPGPSFSSGDSVLDKLIKRGHDAD